MNIRFDQAKRDKTLEERGLDFARAEKVFAGQHLTPSTTGRNMERIVKLRLECWMVES
jgi:uncharacterized DUF497 family protein